MDQPLTTVSAATDHAASHATDEASPLGRARATLRSYGAARLLVLSATGLGMLALFAFLLLQASEPHFTLLYGELELEDSSAIVGRLEALGVSFRLQGEGRAILVPADQALRLRMTLAEEGPPRGGAGGDEIFDQQSALGTTDLARQRQSAPGARGRACAHDRLLADVCAARVHLVLRRRELFRGKRIEPSASVTLHMYGGRRLDHRQVQAVQHLVAAAVPGLSPARIAVVDQQGTLLARGTEGELEGAFATQADELRQAYEARLKEFWSARSAPRACTPRSMRRSVSTRWPPPRRRSISKARWNRKAGESIDLLVNNRLVARGEVVILDDRLGVTMTVIIKSKPYGAAERSGVMLR